MGVAGGFFAVPNGYNRWLLRDYNPENWGTSC
ncbi:MAG: hypothetical protein IOMNBAOH_02451 [Rhodocyclaceae bacterium]|nr:hypothetical protein [Rhodocyclaceae bacterium]